MNDQKLEANNEARSPASGEALGSARNAAILKLWEHHRACMTYLIAGCYGSVASEARKLAKAATKVPPNDKLRDGGPMTTESK